MIKKYILLLLICNTPLIYAEDKSKSKADIPKPFISELFSPPLAIHLKSAPKIDGSSNDPEWAKIPDYTLTIQGEGETVKVILKTYRTDDTFFMLIQYPEDLIVRKHKLWHWDKKKKIYISGTQIENTLTLLFFKDRTHINSADAWIWRAARTDIAGYADDMVLFGNSYQMDKGLSCWFSKFFGEFAGSKIPRFYQRTPKGSAGDVKAKAGFKNNIITVEFARKLNTGHSDDFILNRELPMKMIIQPGKE